MSQHYIFNESGCIPGIPGTFAGCRVDVDEQGKVTQLPLHSPVEQEKPSEEPTQESAPSEQPVDASESPPIGG